MSWIGFGNPSPLLDTAMMSSGGGMIIIGARLPVVAAAAAASSSSSCDGRVDPLASWQSPMVCDVHRVSRVRSRERRRRGLDTVTAVAKQRDRQEPGRVWRLGCIRCGRREGVPQCLLVGGRAVWGAEIDWRR